MKKKLKPGLDLDSIQKELIDTVCSKYVPGTSVRSLAKEVEMSPMKVRKILITGGCYSTDMSAEIEELWHDGKTVSEIAEILSTTVSNVNSYLPYERIVYGMEERSVEADRQQRYRDRKKGIITEEPKTEETSKTEESKTEEPQKAEEENIQEVPPIKQRLRYKTMIIIIGKKLRKFLPDLYDYTSDPVSREEIRREGNVSFYQGQLQEPDDPDKYIWCAEVTANGRGKDKKTGVVLMSANSGFAVISPLPKAPYLRENLEDLEWMERREAEQENEEKIKEYRELLEHKFLEAIRKGMEDFYLPEERVADYIDSVMKIEIIKGRPSTPAVRLEELIERSLVWEKDEDPLRHFNVKGNVTTRKFGYSGFYRHVETAVFQMLEMTEEERKEWMLKMYSGMRV